MIASNYGIALWPGVESVSGSAQSPGRWTRLAALGRLPVNSEIVSKKPPVSSSTSTPVGVAAYRIEVSSTPGLVEMYLYGDIGLPAVDPTASLLATVERAGVFIATSSTPARRQLDVTRTKLPAFAIRGRNESLARS